MAEMRLLQQNEIVRRVGLGALPGLWSKTIVLEEGTGALLLVEGRHEATLSPGSHQFGALFGRLGGLTPSQSAVALVYLTGDIVLALPLDGLYTSDPLPIKLDVDLVLRIEEPLLLVQNQLGPGESLSRDQLAALLHPEAAQVARAFLSDLKAEQLQDDLSLKTRLEREEEMHLGPTLSRNGLRLVRLRALNFRHEGWDRVHQSKADYFLQVSQEEARLLGKQRLFDVFQRSQAQALAEEAARAEFLEKRVGLWERLRQALARERRSQVTTERDLENLTREIDKERLLGDHEVEELKQTLRQRQQDEAQAHNHLLRRLELEREFELKKLELSHRQELDVTELTFELRLEREKLESRLQSELKMVETQLEQRRRQAYLELDIQDREVRQALDWYRQYKEVKAGLREREQQAELAKKRAELELWEREQRAKHSLELERIEALSRASLETLISVSGPEQSRLLAELARTRALKECTPQQILALGAERSPRLAEGLGEVFRALSATGHMEPAERLVAELKESARLSREDYQRNLETMSQMFRQALDAVRDTAIAFGTSPAQRAGET